MSRNLDTKVCAYCESYVISMEQIHEITKKEAGKYYDEFAGMLVCRSICPECLSEYLAWINAETKKVEDLSYYSTFNDEPGSYDGHKLIVKTTITRERAKIDSTFV